MCKTLAELAEAHVEYGGIDSAMIYLDEHPRLWTDAMEDEPTLVRRIISGLIHDRRHELRGDAKRAMAGNTPDEEAKQIAGMLRHEKQFRDTILDCPTYGGRSLRDCNRVQLLEGVVARRKQAESQEMAAKFEENVASLLPDGEITVGAAVKAGKFTVDAISEQYNKIYSKKAK